MEILLKKSLIWMGIIATSPLLAAFCFTTQRSIISRDIQRWVDVLDWEQERLPIALLKLLSQFQEFRNLYYYRLLQGGILDRVLVYFFRLIYRQRSDLFLNSAAKIGPGLFIQHGFSTIVVSDMGENCWINQQVTIGYKEKGSRPQLGNNVTVCAGAKVLGNIKVGDNVTIGANAVVVKDVPANCTVVGIPAKIIKIKGVKIQPELV